MRVFLFRGERFAVGDHSYTASSEGVIRATRQELSNIVYACLTLLARPDLDNQSVNGFLIHSINQNLIDGGEKP